MGTALIFCLFLATHLHAGNISDSATSISTSSISTSTTSALDICLSTTPSSSSSSSSPFDIDEELDKIAASCMSPRDYEQLSGNVVRQFVARFLSVYSLESSVEAIGLAELRATLKFAPLPPWKPENYTDPSESELASAPTIEAYHYYDLKEPAPY